MDSSYRIYQAPEDEITDEARLEGYLKGRAEAEGPARAKAIENAMKALEAEAAR